MTHKIKLRSRKGDKERGADGAHPGTGSVPPEVSGESVAQKSHFSVRFAGLPTARVARGQQLEAKETWGFKSFGGQ